MGRKLKNIKITKKNDIMFDYDGNTRSYMSNSIEVIQKIFDGINFYASTCKVKKRDIQFYQATSDDFDELKKKLSQNPKYFVCGSKHIFSIENIISYQIDDGVLTVCCSNKKHDVHKLTDEELESFADMMECKYAEDEEKESCSVD